MTTDSSLARLSPLNCRRGHNRADQCGQLQSFLRQLAGYIAAPPPASCLKKGDNPLSPSLAADTGRRYQASWCWLCVHMHSKHDKYGPTCLATLPFLSAPPSPSAFHSCSLPRASVWSITSDNREFCRQQRVLSITESSVDNTEFCRQQSVLSITQSSVTKFCHRVLSTTESSVDNTEFCRQQRVLSITEFCRQQSVLSTTESSVDNRVFCRQQRVLSQSSVTEFCRQQRVLSITQSSVDDREFCRQQSVLSTTECSVDNREFCRQQSLLSTAE